jgi:peroxiredoxin
MQRRRFLIASTLAVLGGPLRAAGVMSDWIGSAEAPAIDLYTADDDRFSLANLVGKAVLVNFWATWCEPCIAEMPSLQRLRDRFAPRLEVLGVNHKEGPARIKAFVDKAGITFPIVRDTDGAVAKAWGARIFPSSYLLDSRGRIRKVLVGEADWTSPPLVSTIRALF